MVFANLVQFSPFAKEWREICNFLLTSLYVTKKWGIVRNLKQVTYCHRQRRP